MIDAQRIYDALPVDTLLREEERVQEQIATLYDKSQMIARALAGKYMITEEVRPIDKWID